MDDTIRQAIDGFRAYPSAATPPIPSRAIPSTPAVLPRPQPLAQSRFATSNSLWTGSTTKGSPPRRSIGSHALKHFFDYLIEQRRVIGNPVKLSHMVRQSRPCPKPLAGPGATAVCADPPTPWIRPSSCSCSGVARVSEVVHLQMEY
jgi:hypothetical protein